MPEMIDCEFQVRPEQAGRRLDQVLAERFPEHSRARLQQWTREGSIRVDGRQVKPGARLHGDERVRVSVDAGAEDTATGVAAQDLPLTVLHADEHVLVIDKPPGLVVHPAAGNPDGTLQNALLFHYPELEAVPRSGIVHRLDRDTSGVLVVARSLVAHTALVRQLQDRSMGREYRALVHGALVAGGSVDEPLGRHPRDRKRMAVVAGGKAAVSHYRINERFRDFTLLDVHLETGRTHQIRVHMAHVRHPLVGDPAYGTRRRLPPGAGPGLHEVLSEFRRQALHAAEIRFLHPADERPVRIRAEMPADFARLLEALRHDAAQVA